jgi:RES domain-containing protein
VALAGFLGPWSASAYRHVPAGVSIDLLDLRFAGQSPDNRWNVPGEPTLYLASDPAVVLAEFARHYQHDTSPITAPQTVARQIFRLEVGIARMLDLREPSILAALSLRDAPQCFLDKQVGRAVGQHVRTSTPAQAIVVPSMAFLDSPARWVAVLFLEKLPSDPRQFITAIEAAGTFHLDA